MKLESSCSACGAGGGISSNHITSSSTLLANLASECATALAELLTQLNDTSCRPEMIQPISSYKCPSLERLVHILEVEMMAFNTEQLSPSIVTL